jgi:transcriptional repressor NrdR
MNPIYIIKKDGRREIFDKNKIKTGVMKALEKRPISHDRIEQSLDSIEEKIRRLGKEEIESSIIGEIVMDELKTMDQVAYIRFASVYRSFADITLFEKEVQKLTEKTPRGEKT